MKINTTIRIKNCFYELATELANKYYLSRSTVINIAIAKLSRSKYLDRFIKQGITRNTPNLKTKTTWSTSTNLLNLVKNWCKKYECNYTDIVTAALSYIQLNGKKPKYYDLTFKRIIERNKNKWARKKLI